jgi:hypothetical protein
VSDAEPRIEELRLSADHSAWVAAGLAPECAAGGAQVGTTRLAFEPPSGGGGSGAIIGWTLRGLATADLDGLPTTLAGPSPPPAPGTDAALRIDHVVIFTARLERTIDAFEAAGIRCRRIREVGPVDRRLRQAFFRFGEVIAEVVEVPEEQAGPGDAARFWGLTLAVADLERLVAELGERVGTIRDAVQPGRRIATIRRQAGLGVPVALISPEPPREGASRGDRSG